MGSPYFMATCLAWFMQTRFRSCQHYMGEVGHTHGPLDQRYSVVASALAQCNVLQCPQDSLGFGWFLDRWVDG